MTKEQLAEEVFHSGEGRDRRPPADVAARPDAPSEDRRLMQLRVQEVDGATVGYHSAGAGPPLVLLHGLGDTARAWRWVLPLLVGAYRVYAVDLPGLGAPEPADDYSPERMARRVLAFCDAQGIEAATFTGNSLGARSPSTSRCRRPIGSPGWDSSPRQGSGPRSPPRCASRRPPGWASP